MKDETAWLLTAREAADDTAGFDSWAAATTRQTRRDFKLPDEFTMPA